MSSQTDVTGLTAEEALARLEAEHAPAPRRRAGALLGLAVLAALPLIAMASLFRTAAPRVERVERVEHEPAPPPASAVPSVEPAGISPDAAYLEELAADVDRRTVTWQRELADAEHLIADAGVEPRHVALRADDVFAGARARPRVEIEGHMREAGAMLQPSVSGGLTVRRYGDRTGDDGVTVVRTLEGYW